MISNIFKNLWSGLAVFLLPRRPDVEFRPSAVSVCFGLMVSLLIIGAFDYARQTGEIYFSDIGAAQLGTILFIALFTSVMICRIQSDYSRLPIFLTVLVCTLPWYLIVLFILKDYSGHLINTNLVWLAALYWGLVLLFRSIRISFQAPLIRSYVVIACVTLMTISLAHERYFKPELFFSYSPDEFDLYAQIDQERIYYQQRHLVKGKVDMLQPQTPDHADIYFVGFAGNGDEKIFKSEVNFARTVVDSHFKTKGRSILLASDIENLDEEPLANAYNLESVLKSVGAIMDVKEDILFLFLTSHGSDDATLEISLYPFNMRDLSSTELREALDSSGIQWRIIVLSACYSGSFIEALADEKTLVLSAAAADRTSFGCSDERELTYFGEALFSDALKDTKDLIVAFHAAKKAIEEKESVEGLEASKPQMYAGPEILIKLEALGLIGNQKLASE